MAAFFENLCEAGHLDRDDSLLAEMRAENATELAVLVTKEEEAVGDLDIYDAALNKAQFFVRTGDKEGALKAYAEALEKSLSVGQKLDVMLQTVRVGLFHADYGMVKDKLVETRKMADDGGDWDRRNRLKIHEAVNSMLKRQFKDATENFLSSIVTYVEESLLYYSTVLLFCYTAIQCGSSLHVDTREMKRFHRNAET